MWCGHGAKEISVKHGHFHLTLTFPYKPDSRIFLEARSIRTRSFTTVFRSTSSAEHPATTSCLPFGDMNSRALALIGCHNNTKRLTPRITARPFPGNYCHYRGKQAHGWLWCAGCRRRVPGRLLASVPCGHRLPTLSYESDVYGRGAAQSTREDKGYIACVAVGLHERKHLAECSLHYLGHSPCTEDDGVSHGLSELVHVLLSERQLGTESTRKRNSTPPRSLRGVR